GSVASIADAANTDRAATDFEALIYEVRTAEISVGRTGPETPEWYLLLDGIGWVRGRWTPRSDLRGGERGLPARARTGGGGRATDRARWTEMPRGRSIGRHPES